MTAAANEPAADPQQADSRQQAGLLWRQQAAALRGSPTLASKLACSGGSKLPHSGEPTAK